MSAHMVEQTLVDVLVAAAIERPHGITAPENRAPMRRIIFAHNDTPQNHECHPIEADSIGQMLIDENLASVQTLYPRILDNPDDTPGPRPCYWTEPYMYQGTPARSPLQALEALNHYEYQACERQTWHHCEARRFCIDLREEMIRYLMMQIKRADQLDAGWNDTDWRRAPLRQGISPLDDPTAFSLRAQQLARRNVA